MVRFHGFAGDKAGIPVILIFCGTGTLACAGASFLRKRAPAGEPPPPPREHRARRGPRFHTSLGHFGFHLAYKSSPRRTAPQLKCAYQATLGGRNKSN